MSTPESLRPSHISTRHMTLSAPLCPSSIIVTSTFSSGRVFTFARGCGLKKKREAEKCSRAFFRQFGFTSWPCPSDASSALRRTDRSTWWSTRDPCRILSFKTCDSDEIGSGWGLGATFSSEAKLFLFLVLTITSAATATSRNNSSMWHVYLSIYGFCFGMVADSYQHGYQLHGFC